MWTGLRDGACHNAQKTSWYDWGYRGTDGRWSLLSSRGFYYRNCTDFVAWYLGVSWSSFRFGSNGGNAAEWAAYAPNIGLQRTSNPSVGDVAWWGGRYRGDFGHVAIVSAVNPNGTVTVVEYNGDGRGNYGVRSNVRPIAFLHRPTAAPATPPPPSTPPPATPPSVTPSPAPGTPAPTRRVITIDNRVTNGMGMREDPTPVRLTTEPWIRCSSRGCNIAGTERTSGQTFDAAVCQRVGERTTNGNDSSPDDDANPLRFESTRYYGVRLSNGTFGYVSEVWIRSADRGGLGLPTC